MLTRARLLCALACVQSQPLTARLQINADPLPIGTDRGDYFEAAWFFINGEFRGRLPLAREVLLAPGRYDFSVVIGVYRNERPELWTIRWPRMPVAAGPPASLDVTRTIEAVTNGRIVAGAELTVPPEPATWSHLTVTEGMLAAFEQTAIAEMDQAWARYRTGSDFAKIEAIDAQLQQSPPSRPVVWIDVSDVNGGPREFDPEQLRFLARRLKPNLNGWTNRIVQYSPAMRAEQRNLVEAAISRLKQRNAAYADHVTTVFRRIGDALGKAGKR